MESATDTVYECLVRDVSGSGKESAHREYYAYTLTKFGIYSHAMLRRITFSSPVILGGRGLDHKNAPQSSSYSLLRFILVVALMER
jgi:hypothetical protein